MTPARKPSPTPARNHVVGPPITESSHVRLTLAFSCHALTPPTLQSAQPNEVVVDRRPLDDFVNRGLSLLSDPLMLYIFFSAKNDPEAVGKAVKAAEAVKRRRKVETGEELVQYVVDDDDDSRQVISLFLGDKRTDPSTGSSVPVRRGDRLRACVYCAAFPHCSVCSER